MSELSDRVLWRQAGEGHAGAFGILFERHAGRIYNYCFRRTADWALAEELTSTTFLLAWRSRSRAPLRAESALPLLYGIATNVVRNQRRSLKRRREALLRLPLERSEEPDFAEEIAARIDDEAGMQELLRLFAQLPRPFPAGARPAPAAGTRNGERTRSGGRCRPASHRGDRAMSFRLTPPPERDFPAGRLQQRKEQLVSEIYATAEPAPRYPRRILVSVVAIAVAGIFAAAAYAGYALTRPVTPVVTIGCYETDS
ncbi:MAG TPA: RNA polymerase sigma factor, partial [Gaiellaceae bacterium]